MKKILLMIDMQNDFITNATCAKIGMSLSYVQKVEQGYKKPTDEVYLK